MVRSHNPGSNACKPSAGGRAGRRLEPGWPVQYKGHRLEQSTLYRLVQQHAATFFAQIEAATGADFCSSSKTSSTPFSRTASWPTIACGCAAAICELDVLNVLNVRRRGNGSCVGVNGVFRSADGVGRVPAARGRAVALRVEPLSKAQRLAPDGRPSLTQHGLAGVAGGDDDSGPFPCPGIAGLVSFTGT